MPIYEYQCKACGHEMEKLQRISDAPLTDCPACDRAELRKKISAAGFRLKGGGWYETDFKTGGKKNLAGEQSSSKGESKGQSKAKPSTDKPAAAS
ncbi:FmdB family zinc ribbon protein [Microbulbifer litoralis]|uniref:FmdB family zinc ribbon protein n=1 Tax=Microbulbifer litoralis TaxID=2933965 RepID=UPI002029034A|nr:zinc ribbon domain-containing protein [Microbulbifer sp. GX H0434]